MGLLDDAIREHLDLKRRRGADPAEVERAEQEALGPVRRQPEPAEDIAFDQEGPLAEEGLLYEDEAEHEWDEDLHDEELSPAPPVAPPPAFAAEQPGPPSDLADPHWQPNEESFVDDEPVIPAPAGERPAAPVEPARQPASQLGEETAEYDVELEHRHADGEQREDMLEETPEVLQDAPDHDRLWFEQRPPRDFNFDS
jgi:hypothetical protein